MRNYYSNFRSLAMICFLIVASIGSAWGQVSGYAFTNTTGAYTPITGGSVLGVATNDDTSFPSLPIGFTFNYNGTNYTQFSAQSNGFIALGTAIASSYTPLSTGTTNNVISAIGDDLQGNTGTGELRYETIGTAPNRTLVVQWTSYRKFAATGDNYNFQIRLSETSNVITVHYGTVTNNATANTCQTGLRGASNADFNNRTTTTNWATAAAGGTNAATMAITSTVFPASGTIYRWTAPPANPVAPVQLGGIPTCTTGAQLGFTTTALSCSTSATASGFDNAATTATVNNFSCATGTVTSATLNATIGGNCPAWYSYSIVVNGATVATNQCNQTGFDLTPYLPLTSVSIVSADAPGDGGDNITLNLTVNLNYSVPFSMPADVVYYWQTTPTGTSQSTPHVDPYNVFANGTYYVRAFNTVTGLWSTGSSSVTVSNFPLAAAPPAPVATVNPSCAPAGSTLTVAAPPANVEYYWQGTTANGSSNALPATSPYAYSTSGTYHVSAYDLASQCWSASSSTTVTVDNVIPPAPVLTQTDYNYCSGAVTAPVTSPLPVLSVSGNCTATATATGLDISGVSATVTDFSCALAPITSASLNATIGGNCPAWYFYSIVVNGVTVASNQCNQNNFDLTPYLPLTSVSIVAANAPGDSQDNVTLNLTVNYSYSGVATSQPAYTLNWYDAATGGNIIGSGTSLETVGTSVMPTATLGAYDFYVGSVLGGCVSATNSMVTVNISEVNAVLTPVNATCNGGENGSFTLGTVQCGTEPFMYSVDGGTFDATIPTNLTAGTYSVVIEDDNGLLSSPITVVITEPAAPSNITVTNINYFTADVSWTTTGDETSWSIEYGPAGFTPGTGTIETATSSPFTLTGLVEDTEYDVYVTAVCGAGSQAGGPATFSTNPGFFTFDNACGPGFNDISSTGTCQDLGDDGQVDFTMPWTWNYQGLSINTLSIDNNGGISFVSNAGVPFTNGAIATAANGLYPYWDDLFSNGGSVCTQVIGTSPNQQVVIQWNVDHISYDGTDLQFQVVIDEATGEVYFIYENSVLGNAAYDNAASATIGAAGPQTDVQVSFNSATYLQNNSCVHFYNALCPNPVVTSVQTFQEDVILDWAAGPYGETEWTLIWGEAGFDPATEGNTESGITTSEFTISGLTQLTSYDFYIYSECTIDNLTSGGLLVEATTLPWCNTPTTLAGTTDVDSLFATWNWTPVVGAANPLSGFNIQYGDFGFDLYNGTLEVATGIDFADTVTNVDFLAGGVYQVYVQAVCGVDTSNYAGPFTFVMPLSNDTVCGAEMLSVDGTVYYFNNTGATVSLGENAIIPAGSNPDGYNNTILPQLTWGSPIAEGSTWFTFEAPASGSMWFSGNDQNFFASQIAIYEATDCGDFTTFELVAASDQVNEDISSKIAPHFTVCGLTPGQTYYIMHEAWSNGFGGAPIFGQYSIKMTPIVLEAGSVVDVLDVCSGSAVDLFDGITGNDAGGIWTAEIPAAGTGINGSDFSSAGLAYQVFNFEYRVTEGCAYDSIVSQVEIWAPSSAGTDGTIDVCRNEPFDLLSGLGGNVDMGGTWYNPTNQVMPSSATTASNIPGQFNYNYITGNGVCPDDTALVLVNVSSTCNYLNVEEMYFADMTVYPNPSNGVFNIANEGSAEVFNYEVTDIEGRIIATKEAAINGTSTTEIDLTGKVTGVYMIRVYNDNAEKVFRVVLQ